MAATWRPRRPLIRRAPATQWPRRVALAGRQRQRPAKDARIPLHLPIQRPAGRMNARFNGWGSAARSMCGSAPPMTGPRKPAGERLEGANASAPSIPPPEPAAWQPARATATPAIVSAHTATSPTRSPRPIARTREETQESASTAMGPARRVDRRATHWCPPIIRPIASAPGSESYRVPPVPGAGSALRRSTRRCPAEGRPRASPWPFSADR